MKLSSLCLAAAAAASLLLTACNGQSSILSLNNGNTPVTTGWEFESQTQLVNTEATNGAGVYGTEGTASAANNPGARQYATTWTDTQGNMWLAGGFGFDSVDNQGWLADLWKMDAGVWTSVNGPNTVNAAANYGVMNAPATTNSPGGHSGSSGWTDSSGNLWLFGGASFTSTNSQNLANALWEYTNGEWVWKGGASTFNQMGTYGVGASTNNIPGSRELAASWVDTHGNFWLFGGFGYDSAGSLGLLNDLWEFNPNNGQWTWQGGSNLIGEKGTYGAEGFPAGGNIPGAREADTAWADPSGNLWLFGGFGLDSGGTTQGDLNDLWEYTGGQWKWVGGSNLINQTGVYGTEGTAAAANVPGARDSASGWVDASGNLWLFGGFIQDASNVFDDLWEFKGGEWDWVGGSDLLNEPGAYVTAGTLVAGNLPGGRFGQASWKPDSSGNFWIFGGQGVDGNDFAGYLSDLWKFVP